jgi:hypothetical protein
VAAVNSLSLYAVFVRLFFDDIFLSKASAFLWRHDGRTFLISNWHVFSGRKPKKEPPEGDEEDDEQPLHTQGAIPNQVECLFYRNRLSGGQPVSSGVISEQDKFPLIDQSGQPLYLEHPFGSRADIAALPIELHPHVVPYFLNEYEFDENVEIYAGQDVSIIGYPFGLITRSPLPIWKRGSIASEPNRPIGFNKIFVDTATRPGMSGSFVVAQHSGFYSPEQKPSFFGLARRLLGIYSGRVGPSEFEAQLGIVWLKEEIDRVVQRGRRPPP